MKTRDILVGKQYTDGKGNVREVIAAGEQYVLYKGQSDTDCVRYRLIARGKHQKASVGTEDNTTRNSFAKWAKSEVAA